MMTTNKRPFHQHQWQTEFEARSSLSSHKPFLVSSFPMVSASTARSRYYRPWQTPRVDLAPCPFTIQFAYSHMKRGYRSAIPLFGHSDNGEHFSSFDNHLIGEHLKMLEGLSKPTLCWTFTSGHRHLNSSILTR
jgi:hypothetical protein